MREHCFGWDPVFQPKGWETSYAEMTKEEQNSLSHQYNVLDKLRSWLERENRLFGDPMLGLQLQRLTVASILMKFVGQEVGEPTNLTNWRQIIGQVRL